MLYTIKKFPTLAQIRGRQLAMVLKEPWQQVIVFNSLLHLSLSFCIVPGQPSPVARSLPSHLRFFLIVLCPYYTFLFISYSILLLGWCQAWCLKLGAWSLLFIFVWRFKIICDVVLGHFSPEPLHRAALQPVMELVAHWWYFTHNFPFCWALTLAQRVGQITRLQPVSSYK